MQDLETLEAVVKFEAFLCCVRSLPLEKPDPNVLKWFNAWLGPHWIFWPEANGIVIFREGGLVYRGTLENLPGSDAAKNHEAGMRTMHGNGFDVYLRGLADNLLYTLNSQIGRVQSTEEIQSEVQAFFAFHKSRAANWFEK